MKKINGFEDIYITTKLGKIHYLVSSRDKDKDFLILIHGFSDKPESFIRSLKYLRKKFNIILPSVKGFDFEGYNEKIKYSLDYYEKNISEICKFEEIEKFHLGGNSLGGAISLQVYTKKPTRVLSLSLINIAGFEYDGIETTTKGVLKGQNPFLIKNKKDFYFLLDCIFHKTPYLPSVIKHYMLEDFKIKRSDFEKISTSLFKTAPDLAIGNHLVPPKNITIPTLLVWGESDKLFPLEIAKRASTEIKDVNFKIIKNSSHIPHIETPKKLALIFKDYYERFSRDNI